MFVLFGMYNLKLKVFIKDVYIIFMWKIGVNKNYLKLVFEDSGVLVDVVGFGLGYILDEVFFIVKVLLVGELFINEWNNMCKL